MQGERAQFASAAGPICSAGVEQSSNQPQPRPECSSWRLAQRSLSRRQVRPLCACHCVASSVWLYLQVSSRAPCFPSAGPPARPRPQQPKGLPRPLNAHGASIPGHGAAQQPPRRCWRHRRKAPALRAMASSGPESGAPAARGALPGQIGALLDSGCGPAREPGPTEPQRPGACGAPLGCRNLPPRCAL